jgi:RND family efflux transporter MFP subunit
MKIKPWLLRNKWWITGTVVVLLVAGFLIYRYVAARRSSNSTNIRTSTVQRGTLTISTSSSGTVRSGQSATISWQASGKVGEITVQLGQQVQAGDVLALLDPNSILQSIMQSQTDLINAQNTLDELLKPQPLKIAQAESALADAQAALDNLLNPTSLAMAQAESAVTNAQTTLDNLLYPSPVAIAQAETAVLNAQDAVNTAQAEVDRLGYARGSAEQISAARATYTLAQQKVDNLQAVYDQTPGLPDTDPAKAQALNNLVAAKTQRDRALANLNWYFSSATEAEIAEKQTKLALTLAQLADAQNTLDQLKNPTVANIELAKARVADATESLDLLKNPATVDIELAKARVADAQKALDKLKNPEAVDIELAKQRLADAQETLDAAKNGPTQEEITIAETRVSLAKTALEEDQVTAPFAGTITSIQSMAGDTVSQGKTAFRIDDLSRLFIDLSVTEFDVSSMAVGQLATVTFDALSGLEYTGKVTQVGVVGTATQGVVSFPVTVEITNPDESVLPGMTASVAIITQQDNDVLMVPNQAIKLSSGQRTVTILYQGQQISVPVTVGLSNDTMSEITGDTLKVGDVIVINVSTTTSSNTSNRISNFPGGGDFSGGGGVFIGP